MKRIDERIDGLDADLNTSSGLEEYLGKLKELFKELYLELNFAAEELQENLATLPVQDSRFSNGGVVGSANSKVRAKLVADNLRRIAESCMYSGGGAVKTWQQFVKTLAPEIETRKQKQAKPRFRLDM
jgi:hypothetical protein